MAELECKNGNLGVFETGNLKVQTIKVKKSDSSSPPTPLYIVAPVSEGTYPLLLFCHSYCIQNTWYSQLLQHISSHGYIIVAPQFYKCMFIALNNEVKTAAKVTDWLCTGLQSVLPEKVKPNLSKVALSGHGRGGKIAFDLALGHAPTSLKFKALLGIDPVAYPTPPTWPEPEILTYIPRSFNLSIPIGVIGTGLGNQPKCMMPPFAPNGINHAEFFNESKPPCSYFLAKDYGGCDVLDDSKAALASWVCKSGKGSKALMRKGVGGIAVAFLKAYLGGQDDELKAIADAPTIAPITLDSVIFVKE
ncbi:Chlorophyllase-1 [Abeliophyllum distichum]|uniref:Chlorophyllase-1 n=1 Tax=Abeliophyllum distichum TaxID=126358 RepID=A0ABD1Q304_9LAMI